MMKTAIISAEEIKKSSDFNLSPKFYTEFKPKIKRYILDNVKSANVGWVDTLDYRTAELLYEVVKQRDLVLKIRKDIKKTMDELT